MAYLLWTILFRLVSSNFQDILSKRYAIEGQCDLLKGKVAEIGVAKYVLLKHCLRSHYFFHF